MGLPPPPPEDPPEGPLPIIGRAGPDPSAPQRAAARGPGLAHPWGKLPLLDAGHGARQHNDKLIIFVPAPGFIRVPPKEDSPLSVKVRYTQHRAPD